MAKPTAPTRKQSGWRLSIESFEKIVALAEALGISQTATIELLIRKYADREFPHRIMTGK